MALSYGSYFLGEPCTGRCEKRSTRSTAWGGVQQKSRTARSKRVCPETAPLTRLNENAVSAVAEAPPKRSRRSAQKAEAKWGESGHDHISIIAARKGVDGEGSGKFTHDETSICSCDIEMRYHFGKGNIQEPFKPSLNRGAENEEVNGLTFSCLSCFKSLRAAFGKVKVPEIRWLSKKRRNIFAKRRGEGREKTTVRGLESLPFDIREIIFGKLPLKELFLSKTLSKSCKAHSESDTFLRSRGAAGEGSFTAINFFMKDKAWECTGLDLHSKTWTRLPTLSYLPTPDANLFKEYSVCGHGGLMCANVSKLPHKEDLVVFNPLTGETRKLPSLHYPRNPVLIHILVDSATNAYKVIAAGSASSSGEENLSRRVEVFDSLTWQWEIASDLPGPEFGLNEHQTGVCVNGILYFVAFLENDGSRGVVAFDAEKRDWFNYYVPFSLNSNILQLVESDGKVYLFSEQEHGGAVEHCIDMLDFSVLKGEVACQLKSIIRVKTSGGRGLLVYPEYTCIPHGKGKLCIFNTIKRDGVVYDIQNGVQCEALEPPPVSQRGDNFFSLNPVSFTVQPNFTSKP